MFKYRSHKKELIDDLAFSSPLLIPNLQEMAILNHWLGFNRSLVRSIQKIVHAHQNKPINIADIGCGSGDTLRYISNWAHKKGIQCNLVGIDANQHVIHYARAISASYPHIQYKTINILENVIPENNDIVIINHLCHHLSDEEIVQLITDLSYSTKTAIVMNDLHRHCLAYFAIKIITIIFGFSYLTKHDGPLSVLKAFRKKEIISLLLNIKNTHFELKWVWPFRWQAIIWCKSNKS
jgi:2-polyprenyl-3-methyl-5-hydroxy-6-metoxy-1,4-benzoquinol methylase